MTTVTTIITKGPGSAAGKRAELVTESLLHVSNPRLVSGYYIHVKYYLVRNLVLITIVLRTK
jgi:hypothetical protein